MKDTATGKFLYFDPAHTPPVSPEGAFPDEASMPEPAEALSAIVDSLIAGEYDPVLQLSSYLIANDPTFLPEDTDARTIAHPVGRDKLLEALLLSYMEHRNHD